MRYIESAVVQGSVDYEAVVAPASVDHHDVTLAAEAQR